MRSESLRAETANEVIECLRKAAGEVEHTIDLLDGHVSAEDLGAYKRMVGKIVIAIYSGLADPVLEAFPTMKEQLYRESHDT